MVIKVNFKKVFAQLSVGAALIASGLSYAATELTVYGALESEDQARYTEAFQKAHPDIRLNWIRDSTGIITARLLAEKDNPRADVIWGLAATSMMLMEDMLLPYAPEGLERLSDNFRDSSEVPKWVGMDAWMASICFNTIEAEKHNLPTPTSWWDLTKPEYQGHVVMPNPASSGTGFLDVSSWLQDFGEEQGWAYMDALHENIDRYTHSGSQPCTLAASGEVPIGISFAYRGALMKDRGAPIDLVFPSEGVGWDMEAAAIVKGTDKLEAAKTLMNFIASEEANKLYNEAYAIVAIPEVIKPVRHFPENPQELMIDNDFTWSASNRERILQEWQQRYDNKTEG